MVARLCRSTVAQLDELDREGRAAHRLARQISGRAAEFKQGDPFGSRGSNESIAVQVDGLRLGRGRSFGAVWLGWILWQALKLDALLAELLPEQREAVTWSQVVAILVLGRLREPSSDRRALVSHHGTGSLAREQPPFPVWP